VTPPPANPPQAGAQQNTSQQQASNVPPSTGPTAGTGATGVAQLRFEPAAAQQPVGSTFNVQLLVNNVQDLFSVPMQVNYDPRVLQISAVSAGDFLSRDGQPVALVHREDAQSGTITLNATRPPSTGGVSGSGVLYTFTFVARAPGEATLTVSKPGGRSSTMNPISMPPTTATIAVR
jgi:general secretion pathway protein D